LTLATHNVLPSGVRSTAPGYQPVGIRPRTALASGASLSLPRHFFPRRTTATQLLVPLVAYSVLPSELRVRALVPLPNGRRSSGRHEIVSTMASVFVSMTETVSLAALATNRRRPSGLNAIPEG
jgi:hypothetical protein